MLDYQICRILPNNQAEQAKLTSLLAELNLRLDTHLDYTLGLYSSDNELIATASCFQNTLRCLAVKKDYQGEGLLAPLVSELVKWQFAHGYQHIFVYTKVENISVLKSLNFHLITQTASGIAFLENKAGAFANYLKLLKKETAAAGIAAAGASDSCASLGNAAIVMNANPFTKGHLYLVEKAAKQADILHLFIVRAEESVFPFANRKSLVQAGTAHIPNIVYHDTNFYMVSTATFPAYFQKDSSLVTEGQASLEAQIFIEIAKALNIKTRFLGTEPYSKTTAIYNEVLARELSKSNLTCKVIQRKDVAGNVISATKVRQAILANDMNLLNDMLPKSTLDWLTSKDAETVINNIRARISTN